MNDPMDDVLRSMHVPPLPSDLRHRVLQAVHMELHRGDAPAREANPARGDEVASNGSRHLLDEGQITTRWNGERSSSWRTGSRLDWIVVATLICALFANYALVRLDERRLAGIVGAPNSDWRTRDLTAVVAAIANVQASKSVEEQLTRASMGSRNFDAYVLKLGVAVRELHGQLFEI